MSTPVDIPEIRNAIAPMSVEFYHASSDLGWIDENTELLQGIPVKKISKSPEHEYIVSLLLTLIEAVLPKDHFVVKERPITTTDSEPEPDLMVVSGSEKDFRKKHPDTASLIIEVSISTLERDRHKAGIYAASGVSEYWIVDPTAREITVFREPRDQVYQSEKVYSGEAEINSIGVPNLEIVLPDLFD